MTLERGIAAILAIWLLLTVLRQLTPESWWRFDLFSLVPRWTFFAPKPIRHDYLVLYRDTGADGTPGPWRDNPYGRKGSWGELVFNPKGRCFRVVYIFILQALRAKGRGLPEQDPFWLGLIEVIRSWPGEDLSGDREAVIMRSQGVLADAPPQAVMTTGRFPLDA